MFFSMKIAVILPAAGVGKRFADAAGANVNKLEQELLGKPVFLRAIELFLGRSDVRQVILAVNPQAFDEFELRWGDKLSFHGVTIVPGGVRERWETVLRAIERVSGECTHIAVHDAARPMASDKLIDRVFEAAATHSAVIPALPVANTVKRVARVNAGVGGGDPLDAIFGDAGRGPELQRVVETVDRRDLVEVQTPQVFEAGLLRRAYEPVSAGKLDASRITDDAGLVEALGDPAHPVLTVEGEAANLKITRPADVEIATAVLEKRLAAQAKAVARKQLFGDDDD